MNLLEKLIISLSLLIGNYGLAQDVVDQPQTRTMTYMGVYVSPVNDLLRQHLGIEKGTGLLVNRVAPESPAAAAKVANNDILLKLDDQILINPEQLAVLVRLKKVDDKVTLELLRKGQKIKVSVTLAERQVPVKSSKEKLADATVNGMNQLNQIYANPNLSDQEKTALINQYFRERGLYDAQVKISNRSISVSPPKAQQEQQELQEILKTLPTNTRKYIEEQLKRGNKVRILNTPNGPVFIMENSFSPSHSLFLIPGNKQPTTSNNGHRTI